MNAPFDCDVIKMGSLGVNFINILQVAFSLKCYAQIFCDYTLLCLCIFWQNQIGKTTSYKMLVKLTTLMLEKGFESYRCVSRIVTFIVKNIKMVIYHKL